ncbi:hypothetical protein DPMN_144135 [Dreissena polymorpha]|uniref:Uncharacterized protein n=1 Tax=Dreissena polymorpha TaxID=45954 RepID=A0A9D4GEV7_DREPO|nr:hypothetical protein DPMN_144135 [Dreissena polymorpha]
MYSVGDVPKFHEEINCKLPLWPYIIKTNLTKFHEDWTLTVTIREKCPAHWQPYIIAKKILTKFHADQTLNVAFTVLSRKNANQIHLSNSSNWTINVTFGPYMYYEKCRNPGGHVFQPTRTIFELIQDIIGTILLTKVHKDRTINVASRPNGCHVFQPTRNIIEFAQVDIRTNLLTKFHADRTIHVTSRV